MIKQRFVFGIKKMGIKEAICWFYNKKYEDIRRRIGKGIKHTAWPAVETLRSAFK